MSAHLRGNLLLLVLTVLLCCGLYPLALWAVGRAFFPAQAAGSLIDEKGELTTDATKARGSRLIGQPFTASGYFQPRPSAAGSGNGYNASASGASNLAASNPKLRDRVARQLGPMVVYRSGEQPDIVGWLTPARVRTWADEHPDAAGWWFEADKEANEKLIGAWLKEHPEHADAWKKDNPDRGDPNAADLVVPFFASYARKPRPEWPSGERGNAVKAAVQAVFFDSWLQDNPKADLKPVPADMVLASGSGLDPHITLRNANYQAPRVVEDRAKTYRETTKTAVPAERVEAEVAKLVNKLIGQLSFTPMWGLAAGDRLVNVLELNLALDGAMRDFKVE